MTFTLQDAWRREQKLARKEAKLLGLIERKDGPRRRAYLDKITAKREANLEKLNSLIEPDKVSYELFETDIVTGVRVTVTDSVFDDTFVGGEAASLRLFGSRDSQGFGSTLDLIPDTFEDGTATFIAGSSGLKDKLDGSYDVTASLIQGDNIIFTETLI